jgi:beta-lactamase regulating signal transducer with metallopeptidase domain
MTVYSLSNTTTNKMFFTKPTLYILVAVLYLLTPICILASLGTMVSKKYEVDESYWAIDGNSKLTTQQKKVQSDTLGNQGKQMEQKAAVLMIGALATSIGATTLIIKRRTIIRGHKSDEQWYLH